VHKLASCGVFVSALPRKLTIFLAAIAVIQSARSQPHVDAGLLRDRVLAVVPLVGKGTWDDPKRPMFAPIPSQQAPTDRSGVIAYQHLMSDDGKFALVEFVFASHPALTQVLSAAAAAPNVKAFERGKHTQAEIEATFKQYKKSFSFDTFHPLRVQ
jgi:hypothetical protein